ncbi:MAG TPA: response regulator transcription factor [Ktedonobacterales bacterium]|nr:response regulator transcription factor [Ktedonobacterales bacterium]
MTQHADASNRPIRVLVVDDEAQIIEFLRMGLTYEGFDVVTAMDGAEALRLAQTQALDLIILDIMLPAVDGLAVARQLRQARSDTPIIMLTAREAVDDRVIGLDSGADDYLTKPFAFKELLARMRAALRRRGVNLGRYLTFANIQFDRETRRVTREQRAIDLTPREFELLELFLLHPNQVLPRDTILMRVWGYDYDGDANIIEVFVRRLREKLGDEPTQVIQTVRGIGYVLRE